MRFAVDLLWVKHNNIGGVESYIRNLLDGLMLSARPFEALLLTARDNHDSFRKYEADKRFQLILCPATSAPGDSILWTNLHLDRLVSSLDVDFCFVPNVRKPLFTRKSNRYISTIHDLQPFHYPQYFSRLRRWWLQYSVRRLVKTSWRLIAISEFVRQDIVAQFRCPPEKIQMIYNPISTSAPLCDFTDLARKYGIGEGTYYYTISSMLRHKNTMTLLKMMNRLALSGKRDVKLLISGIKGDRFSELSQYVMEHHLESMCVFTGYVSDEERNTLIKHAAYFLFPSIFEGFGMPVVEALRLGTKVITTRCASLVEVSRGKAIYVNDPFDEQEWLSRIAAHQEERVQPIPFHEYDVEYVTEKYLTYFESLLAL